MIKMINGQHLPFSFGENNTTKEWAFTMDKRSRTFCAETVVKANAALCREGDKLKFKHLDEIQQRVGHRFLGLYFDMWKNSGTNTHYAAINTAFLKLVEEDISTDPNCVVMQSKYVVVPILIAFEEFPFSSHSGENLAKWVEEKLVAKRYDLSSVLLVVPDGASPCRTALDLIKIKDPDIETAICRCHEVARAVLHALGLGGVSHHNAEAKALVKKTSKAGSKLRIVSKAAIALEQAQQQHGVVHTQATTNKGITRWSGIYTDFDEMNKLMSLANPILEVGLLITTQIAKI